MKALLFLLTFIVFTINAQNSIIYDDGSIHESLLETQANKTANTTAACPATNNLVTFYATNNAQRGHMMDLQAINGITILCFEMNFSAGTSNVEIYTKAGTHVGFENVAGAWTLIGTAINVVSAGVNLPTYIPIAVNTPISAGNTQAFYITRSVLLGPTVAYTNGTAVGNILAADANLRIREGTGKEYPFSTNFTPRQFNGRVYYSLGNVLPIELVSFDVYQRETYNSVTWLTESETNNKYFTIERSTDAQSWTEVTKMDGAGNSSLPIHYEYKDISFTKNSDNYYRLKQTDFNGQSKYSNITVANNDALKKTVSDIKIYDIMGKECVEFLSSGLYIKHTQYSDNTIEVKKLIIQ